MGTLLGHLLPGSFFLIFAFWWTIQIFRRYYQSLVKGGDRFVSSATFPCSCLCGKLRYWECEGFMKLFFTTVGLIGEIVTGFDENGKFAYMGNAQHSTMFFFFGMSGVIDIMVHHRVPLPRGIEYAVMSLAFTVEALLFKFHLHGRTTMDVALHTMLLYAVYACIISHLLDMKSRHSVIVALSRAYFLALQGTWFWYVGFLLYGPSADNEDKDVHKGENLMMTPAADDHHMHDGLMTVSMIFTWHLAGILIAMLTIGGIIGCVYRCKDKFKEQDYDSSLQMKLIKKDTNGHTIINLHDDSESDIEFERPPSGLD